MKYEATNETSPWETGQSAVRPTWQRWVRGVLAASTACLAILLTVATVQPRGVRLVGVHEDEMGETIPRGSLVVAVPGDNYQTNDVVVYEQSAGGSLAMSRVVSRSTTGVGATRYRLQDDEAARLERQAMLERNIVGRVEVVAPWVGAALAAVQTPIGFAGLIGLPLMLILWSSLQDARRQWRLALYSSTFYPGPGFSARHQA